MTNRLQHLKKKQLVERVENLDDKLSLLVQLTVEGVILIDKAVASHVKLENDLMGNMTKEELTIVNVLLQKIENQLPKA